MQRARAWRISGPLLDELSLRQLIESLFGRELRTAKFTGGQSVIVSHNADDLRSQRRFGLAVGVTSLVEERHLVFVQQKWNRAAEHGAEREHKITALERVWGDRF